LATVAIGWIPIGGESIVENLVVGRTEGDSVKGLVDFWTARKSEVKFLGVKRRKEDGLLSLWRFCGSTERERERERQTDRQRCECSALGDELGVLIPSRPVCEVPTGSHPG
jgi:hypothetical protein